MEWKLTIPNPTGLRFEILSNLWKIATQFKGHIQIRKGRVWADAKSYIQVVALINATGKKMEVKVQGENAREILETIRGLLLEKHPVEIMNKP